MATACVLCGTIIASVCAESQPSGGNLQPGWRQAHCDMKATLPSYERMADGQFAMAGCSNPQALCDVLQMAALLELDHCPSAPLLTGAENRKVLGICHQHLQLVTSKYAQLPELTAA